MLGAYTGKPPLVFVSDKFNLSKINYKTFNEQKVLGDYNFDLLNLSANDLFVSAKRLG